MIAYISWETALQLLALAYITSAVLLIAISYTGWALLETTDKSGDRPPLPKWFN